MSIFPAKNYGSISSGTWEPLRALPKHWSKVFTIASNQVLGQQLPRSLPMLLCEIYGEIGECPARVLEDLYFAVFIIKIGLQNSIHAEWLLL